MSYFKAPYSIDNLIKYSRSNFSRYLNYLVNESENNPHNQFPELKTAQYAPKFNSLSHTLYSNIQYTLYKNPTETMTTAYYFTPKLFLKPQRPKTGFISITEDIRSFIEEAFELLTNKKLPENILIRVCNKEELRQIHSEFGSWNDNIQGFALNGKNLKRIFVKNAHLDELMLTIGHELGHVFTQSLPNIHDEEAKAFSFAVKWAETIRKNNIGNLASCVKENIDFEPARNGLHDISFLFVKNLLKKKDAMQIHWDLVKGYVSLWNFYN